MSADDAKRLAREALEGHPAPRAPGRVLDALEYLATCGERERLRAKALSRPAAADQLERACAYLRRFVAYKRLRATKRRLG